jgi:very-short-patch-repair endonuclease
MADQLFDPRRPFLRADGLAAGLTDRQLRGPGFRQLFRSVFVLATTPATALQRITGALLLQCDQAWASHASAAKVLDAPIPTIGDEHVSVPHQKLRRHHPGIRCHVGRSTPTQVVDGVRISADLAMFVEMAELVGLVDLVVLGDWLVRRRGTTPAKLVAFCRASRHKQARRALVAAQYVRKNVDSPMETRLRMLLVLAGLPEPTVNFEVRDDRGEVVRRYDLSWPRVKLAVEYSGRLHVELLETWEDDVERRNASDEDGWRTIEVISAGIFATPDQTIQRVWRALRTRDLPGLPDRPSDAWRPHFPGHASAA